MVKRVQYRRGVALPLSSRASGIEFVSLLSPQRYTLARTDGAVIARYRQHFNPLVYRLSVAVEADDPDLDDLVVLAAGCLITAIEGRQSAG